MSGEKPKSKIILDPKFRYDEYDGRKKTAIRKISSKPPFLPDRCKENEESDKKEKQAQGTLENADIDMNEIAHGSDSSDTNPTLARITKKPKK